MDADSEANFVPIMAEELEVALAEKVQFDGK